MYPYLFTSESVAEGHPDKVADQIADAILDACIMQDSLAKVACETLVTGDFVLLAGEIATHAKVDYEAIARQTIREIGYNDPALGFDDQSCAVEIKIHRQSPDIALGVDPATNLYHEWGAGDQGIMFGYACDDTPEMMPLPIMLAHRIVRELHFMRSSGKWDYLRPDAKAQVTIEYDEQKHPKRLHTVVISTQHAEHVAQETIHEDMKSLVARVTPPALIDDKTLFYINPTGRFVIGGPAADTGLTGRKIIIDTYGGMGRHGGGSFSGKDPTKVDRSASYAARYAAKNVVAAKLAKRCEIQLSYAIGLPFPISINLDTFGTNQIAEDSIVKALPEVFNFSPGGIIEMLDLRRPIYAKTAFGGHFGRHEADFSWEKIDRVEALLQAVNS